MHWSQEVTTQMIYIFMSRWRHFKKQYTCHFFLADVQLSCEGSSNPCMVLLSISFEINYTSLTHLNKFASFRLNNFVLTISGLLGAFVICREAWNVGRRHSRSSGNPMRPGRRRAALTTSWAVQVRLPHPHLSEIPYYITCIAIELILTYEINHMFFV